MAVQRNLSPEIGSRRWINLLQLLMFPTKLENLTRHIQTVYIPDITRSSNQSLIKLRFNQPLDSIKDALKANSTVLSWITHYSNNVFASSFCPEGKKASRTLERKSRRKELPCPGMV